MGEKRKGKGQDAGQAKKMRSKALIGRTVLHAGRHECEASATAIETALYSHVLTRTLISNGTSS